MSNSKNTPTLLKQSGAQFYANITESDGNYETVTLNQNLEAPGGDHWRVEFSLQRWRSKAELIKYLQSVVEVVRSTP
jgi:hypothetical protein